MTKRIIIVVASALLLAGAYFAFHFYRLFTNPVSLCDDYRIYITPADTQQSVLESILKGNPEASVKGLEYFLNRRDYDSHIHTGCYTVLSGAAPKQVADMLLGGA